MVRLVVLFALLCLSFWEWRHGAKKALFIFALAALTVFFSLRYGQGTDYLTYLSIYANIEPLHTLPNYFAFSYNKIEIGFFYLISLFRMFGAHFTIFITFVTVFSFFMLGRFIRRFSSAAPILSITIFYAVYSITYMESGIRQMLAIAIVLGFVLVEWDNGHHVLPVVGIALASLFHTSALLMLLLPILCWKGNSKLFFIDWKLTKSIVILSIILLLGAVINLFDWSRWISFLPARLEYTLWYYYQERSGISYLAFANRTLFALIIFCFSYYFRRALTDTDRLLFNMYIIGYLIYILFISFDLIASRCNVYFRIVEIALIPQLFTKDKRFVTRKIVLLPGLVLLVSFLYVKDISAVMDFAQYYDNNPLRYPYITIFNPDKLLNEKFVNIKNVNAMNAYQTGGFSWNNYYEHLQRKPINRSTILPY